MMTATHCMMGATRQIIWSIICTRKQHSNHMEDDTFKHILQDKVPSTAQIRAEGNNTKCVGKKRFNGSVNHRLRKEHVLSPPFLDKV